MERQNNRNAHWIGRRPGKQGPRPILGNQGMVEKLAPGKSLEGEIPGPESALMATGNRIQTRKPIKIGTWNVRSLIESGKLELMEAELTRLGIKVCGLSEHHWTGKGHFLSDNGHKVVYSGNEQLQRQGVGLWLHKDIASSLISYEPINSRLISVSIQALPHNMTIIQVYAPTTVDPEEERTKFYDDLQLAINKASKRSILMVIGDYNAKIGEGPSMLPTIGQFGLGDRNEAGDTLVEFCEANDLSVTNTLFKHPKRRRYTWTQPGDRARNQIDYIMVHKRWRQSVKNSRAYPGADCNSDHNLVVATFQLTIRKRKTTPVIRFDLEELKGPKGIQYATEVSNRFEALDMTDYERRPQELWETTKTILLESATNTIRMTKKPKSNAWISEETMHKADEKRKAKSQDPVRYRQLKAEVQRLVRRDKERHTSSICQQIETESNKGNTRSLFKHIKSLLNERKVGLNMIKSSTGEILVEPKEIAGRWKEYTEELYREDQIGNNQGIQVTETEPPPLKSEIAKAMESINQRKAPGADNIPIELLKYGGNSTLDTMHKICVDVWETGEWPSDWGLSTFIPIPKKGDRSQCSNYRTISLVSHSSKVLLKVILNRIQQKTEQELSDEQAGFRPGRGTRDQITNLRVLTAKLREHKQPVYMCFIDFQKAFDCVQHEKLWWAMLDMGYPPHLVNLLAQLYKSQKAAVRIAGEMSEWFSIQKGVRQGCVLSPYLFNIISETVMRKAVENFSGGVTIGGRKISNLRYADDIVLLASSITELQDLVDRIATIGKEYNLLINATKTKTMSLNGDQFTITVDGRNLEQVTSFPYLGSIIAEDASCFDDVKHRLALGSAVVAKLRSLWKSHSITLTTKIKICKTLVWSIVAYGSESWTIRKSEEQKLQAFEMKTIRRMLGITWQEHRTNESILQDTGYKRELVKTVKKRKLQYTGHIIRRTNSLEKTIMQGPVPGKRGRGRPRKNWMDDIVEWTGLSAEAIHRVALDRQNWRQVVRNAA